MLLKRVFPFFFFLVSLTVVGQDWNKKRSAVVLTYDDALNVHLDQVVPALDSVKLKGTFFLTAAAPAFTKRLLEWKKVAGNQHELANHTLFHPCDGSKPGRNFVTPDYNLATYSVRRMTDEIRMTNATLQALDGKKERTFAYPCGDTHLNGVPYLDGLKAELVAARGVQSELVPIKATNLYTLGSYMINGQTGDELIALVKKAMDTNSMIVFLFHGVGGEHSLNVSLEAHRKLLQFLKKNEKDIWTTTFLEAAKHLKANAPAAKK
ncbi:polysaccharide deacetylase family protein [Rufibacter glacialis]|uniref:Polysaccharide deacetylase family protein n=1 Tax=Rufibacter glacialis TaxID=1259555 RepID=A0A5M8QKN6_9BACT|nr:polysaccharide deacetylase family protein [Rufibacter glacialis]KAA6435544.1 polysaccharide deacetylase family protein [Rufibacter glacialis]GGK64463.1 chitooligosaccharide deacetylase [Rufibacter glacialis]